jgi:hypothetical protein
MDKKRERQMCYAKKKSGGGGRERIAHVRNKEGKGERCGHAKRSSNKFDANNWYLLRG